MGSSAAVATAVTRAFYDYLALPLSREILLEKSSFRKKLPTGTGVESMQPLLAACSRFTFKRASFRLLFFEHRCFFDCR